MKGQFITSMSPPSHVSLGGSRTSCWVICAAGWQAGSVGSWRVIGQRTRQSLSDPTADEPFLFLFGALGFESSSSYNTQNVIYQNQSSFGPNKWSTYRGAAGGTFFLIVGGRCHSFPGARGGRWSFASSLWRLRLRVLVFLCQGKQVAEPAGRK